jgi:hypothetical protein
MKIIKTMAYIGALIGGSLYTVKFALYLYKSKGRIKVDDLVNL